MQTSQVFNQKSWPGSGDVDDCWVISSIQAVNVSLPWLGLVPVPVFRAAAGKPDLPGPSGGQLADVVKGIVGTWPVLAGHVRVLDGAPWPAFQAELDAGRPVTVAVKSMHLPPRLQYGFGGYHQVTVAKNGARYLFANPLAPVYSKWDVLLSLAEISEAVLRYGADVANRRCVFAAALPNDTEAHRLFPQATAQLEEARKAGYEEARTKAVAAVSAI